MGIVVLSLQRYERGNRSQKSQVRVQKTKALWGMKAAKERGVEYCDPARKEDIMGSTKTHLELWEEHLKDPIVALEKAFKLLGESLLGLAFGSKLLVASRVGCHGLQ